MENLPKGSLATWLKKQRINEKRREAYHMKKYGNLKKLEEKEAKFEKWWDDASAEDEYRRTGVI